MKFLRILVTALLLMPILAMIHQAQQAIFYQEIFDYILLVYTLLNTVIIFGIWVDTYFLSKVSLGCCVATILVVYYQIETATIYSYYTQAIMITITTLYVSIQHWIGVRWHMDN